MPVTHAMSRPHPRWRNRWNAINKHHSIIPFAERRTRRWSDDEIQKVSDWMLYYSPAEIAVKLKRTVRGVEKICSRRHIAATRQEYITSTDAAKITGLSAQYLTKLARDKKLRAIRVKSGRWWLFNPETLKKYMESRNECENEPGGLPDQGETSWIPAQINELSTISLQSLGPDQ